MMSNEEIEGNKSSDKEEEIDFEELMKKWEEISARFSPKEREAVEYLRWMKNQICYNYNKVTHQKLIHSKYTRLELLLYFAWGAFVELLDVYKRRKTYLDTSDKQAIGEQIATIERNIEEFDENNKDLELYNLDILHERLKSIDRIEKVNSRLALHLEMFINFFGLVSDHVLSLTPINDEVNIDFEQLFSKVESTATFIKETDALFDSLLQQKKIVNGTDKS